MLGEPLSAIIVRWGTFVAMLVAIGAATFGSVILGMRIRRDDAIDPLLVTTYRRQAAFLGLIGALALVPFAVGRLALQVADLRDSGASWTEPAAMMLRETTWGIGWWLQIGAALACAIGFSLARRGTGTHTSRGLSGWVAAGVGAIALSVTPALSGHAIGSDRFTTLAVVGDALHVLGAGAWIGSLIVLLGTVMANRAQAPSAAAVAIVLRGFSPVALGAAGVVVASGIMASWLHVGTLAALWQTTYGKLLIGKVALFATVVALGAWNWRRLTPQLTSNGGVDRLQRAARTEMVVALLVLLVTAILVATPLPGE